MLTTICLLGLGFALGSMREIVIKQDEFHSIIDHFQDKEQIDELD